MTILVLYDGCIESMQRIYHRPAKSLQHYLGAIISMLERLQLDVGSNRSCLDIAVCIGFMLQHLCYSYRGQIAIGC